MMNFYTFTNIMFSIEFLLKSAKMICKFESLISFKVILAVAITTAKFTHTDQMKLAPVAE